jgi:hypothetical protein
MTKMVGSPTTTPPTPRRSPETPEALPQRPQPGRLRWHPARLLYIFLVALVGGIILNEVQAVLTNPASALDPAQLRNTLFWSVALSYPAYFAAVCVLAVGAAAVGWRLDRRYAALQKEQRHQETVAVAEAVVQRAQVDGRLARYEASAPRDLPPRPLGFVGRRRDLSELDSWLRQGQAVAIVGLGGLGKSSLAAEALSVVASAPGAFPGGVTWVRCDQRSGLDGGIWILDQLLAAWNASLPAEVSARVTSPEDGLELRERALRRRLGLAEGQPSASLVLLDNVEPGLLLGRLLDTLEPLGIVPLLTTRVEPSSQRVRLLRLDALDAQSGVRLFAERFTNRGGNWDATCDEHATQQIVEALGGLPLAIELAAARAARTHLTLPTLAEELRAPDALARLSDPVDPSAGVRYSLAKTLLALTPTERLRFAALGLPEGQDWPPPVIERMFAGILLGQEGVPTPQADLEALVSYSLVRLVTAQGEDAPRLHLHPLVRDLAREEFTEQAAPMREAALAGLLAGAQSWVEAHRMDFAAQARDDDLITGTLRAAAKQQVEPPRLIATVKALDVYVASANLARREELVGLQLASARDRGSEE